MMMNTSSINPSHQTAKKWAKCVLTETNIRAVAIQATDLVQSMVQMHGLKGEGARGLGEAVIAGLLLASYCKAGNRINLNIRANGQYRQALVDAYPEGKVRGYIIERNDGAELDKRLGPWGPGLLSVLRTKDSEGGKPYIGTVPLITGHLAKDLSFYWAQSEQIPSAVGLVVNMKGDEVTSAGGFMVQALPGADDLEIRKVEKHIQQIHNLSVAISKETSPTVLLSQLFQSTQFMVVEERSLQFECRCSIDKVKRSLILLGIAELRSMLEEDHSAVVHCDFCSKDYRLEASELENLIASLNN